MNKAFTKGDAVVFIKDWDGKGAVTYRYATVYSCGNKRMMLTDAITGEEMGRNFNPELGDSLGGTFPHMSVDTAIARCLSVGQNTIDSRIAGNVRTLNNYIDPLNNYIERGAADDGYIRSMKAEQEELRACTPRALSYAEAIAEVDARIAARNANQSR